MGHKYKLRPRPRIDRFSILPDEVAHHILSFLNFTELTRVGLVSKTCRQFYLSIPSLNFDAGYMFMLTKQEQVVLLNSLDRYIFHRGDNRMQCFRIIWSFRWEVSHEHLRVMEWIHTAVRCNVEVLKISFSSLSHSFVMPSYVYLSQSLSSLSVSLDGMILQAPSLSFYCNIRYLKLSEVKIVDESFFKWISCSCKCIKELELIRIRGIPNITVESSSLESFKVWSNDLFHINIFGEKLKDIHITWRKIASSPSRKSLNIFAPNLKNLKWEGNLMNIQNLGRFMSLQKAEIFLGSALNDFDNVFKVICSVCRAKVVILNEPTIKAFLREDFMPAPLDDIFNLVMHLRNLKDDLAPTLVSLLRGMPNLNNLHIKCCHSGVANSQCSGLDMAFWKLQSLAFIDQLKEATLWLSNGSNGIEFARYILEHAQNLENVVIFHSLKHFDVVRELKAEMISNATVAFHVRKW